jgi:hypothetical protein
MAALFNPIVEEIAAIQGAENHVHEWQERHAEPLGR